MPYNKPPLTLDEQCDLLVQRGLRIHNRPRAIETLKHVHYYRLSAYFLPFQTEKDCFNPGTTLDDILQLYEFDRRLSLLMNEILAHVEVGFRSQLAYYLAHTYGPFGYIYPSSFSPDFRHDPWLRRVIESIGRSHETFVKHFRKKYKDESHLPIWMVCEVVSFGQISQLYRGMKRHDRQTIAKNIYGIDQVILASWLHTLVYMRNLCAHHSRLWNRTLAIRPQKPKSSDIWQELRNDRFFSIVMVIKSLIRMPDRWTHWVKNLTQLLHEFSEININAMGFPIDWKELLKTDTV